MLFRNFTPFPALQFDSRDPERRDFGVTVLRGTFKIVHDKPLALIQKQEPLVMADVYYDKPGKSSLKMENNLAPFKPKTDIHIDAVAHAPDNRPAKAWLCGISLGEIKKRLLVMGPRYWHHGLINGWQITKPEPCLQVPIRYEHAFGGLLCEGEKVVPCPENMLGSGFGDPKWLDTSRPIPAPQIMAPKKPVLELGRPYRPEGFLPLPPGFSPRNQYAGTFDVVWEKTKWPDLPDDFNFAFYNSAHPDLIYPGFVNGDEEAVLFRLSTMEELKFRLPGLTPALLVRWEDGQMAPLPMMLDTIHIDVPEMKAYLAWRGIFPLKKPIRVLEARIKQAA